MERLQFFPVYKDAEVQRHCIIAQVPTTQNTRCDGPEKRYLPLKTESVPVVGLVGSNTDHTWFLGLLMVSCTQLSMDLNLSSFLYWSFRATVSEVSWTGHIILPTAALPISGFYPILLICLS